MPTELFRPEVAVASHAHAYGRIRIASRLSHTAWACGAIVFIAVLVCFLVLGRYTRREHVNGGLVPVGGLVALTSPGAGVITQSIAHEGDLVHKGDALLVISGERASVSIGDTQAAVSAALHEQQQRIDESMASTRTLAGQQATALADRVASLQKQSAQLDAQLAIAQSQAETYDTMLEKLKPLAAKGFVSAFQMQQQASQALDAQSQAKALRRQQLEVNQQAEDASEQLRQLPLVTATKISDMQRQRSQSGQQLAQSEAERLIVVRAPRDGAVSSVLAKAGQSVSVGQPLLSMMPSGSQLEAQLLVPTSAIGFVREGTHVSLHYNAFPYQKFGIHAGTVTHASRSALTPAEVTQLMGERAPDEPMYRVMVRLDAQDVMAYGRTEPLQAGMTVEAELLLESRHIYEWVFDPLLGMRQRLAQQ